MNNLQELLSGLDKLFNTKGNRVVAVNIFEFPENFWISRDLLAFVVNLYLNVLVANISLKRLHNVIRMDTTLSVVQEKKICLDFVGPLKPTKKRIYFSPYRGWRLYKMVYCLAS